MNEALKTQGWNQGIMETSSTQKEMLGALRILPDGRKFRYARATATAIAPGFALLHALDTANHINRSAVATAIGSMQVTFSVGATEVTADMYKDGYLQVNAGTAGTLGTQYRIKSHTVVAAAGGSITVQLADPLVTALVATTDKLSLIPNPYSGVSLGGVAYGCAGVTPVAVPASAYFWSQTGGVAACVIVNATAKGSTLVPGANGIPKLWVVDYLQPMIGYAIQVGVTDQPKAIYLTID
jgi:hypothetical protein